MYDARQIRPQPGWILCETLRPITTSKSGLVIAAGDLETGKTTEGVAKVLRITPARSVDGSTEVDPGICEGDRILIRDFVKFANPLGDLAGADRNDRIFLLHITDALAVVSGEGVLGYYGEYQIS